MLFCAVSGVIISLFPWFSQPNKSIEVRINSQSSISPLTINSDKQIKLMFDDHEINEPYFTEIEFKNIGNVPISKSEFEEPIEIYAKNQINIIQANVSTSLPSDLNPNISKNNNSIRIDPLLLNPNDMFRIRILTSESEPLFEVRSRIFGIPEIKISEYESLKPEIWGWVEFAVGILLIPSYIFFFAYTFYLYREKNLFSYFGVVSSFTSLMGFLFLTSYGKLIIGKYFMMLLVGICIYPCFLLIKRSVIKQIFVSKNSSTE